MNRLILIFIYAAVLLLVTTGCSIMFDTIPKDTVMVKKITREKEEAMYEGGLSQEAVKSLSLNAIHKYLGEQLTKDEVQFNLKVIDQVTFETMMTYDSLIPQPVVLPKFQLNDQTEWNQISVGLYYITLTSLTESGEVYNVILNAQDGDVLKLKSQEQIIRTFENKTEDETEDEIQKGIVAAKTFIQEKGSYQLSDLSLNDKMTTRRGNVLELFYTNKKRDKIKYAVTVNVSQNKVIGFSKDVMAMFSYMASGWDSNT